MTLDQGALTDPIERRSRGPKLIYDKFTAWTCHAMNIYSMYMDFFFVGSSQDGKSM